MTDCAKYLNGRGVGSRYDGSFSPGAPVYGSCVHLTGPGWSFSEEYKDFLRKSWEAQVTFILMIYMTRCAGADDGVHL
jgi:glucan 1,3-beta-glucosidase